MIKSEKLYDCKILKLICLYSIAFITKIVFIDHFIFEIYCIYSLLKKIIIKLYKLRKKFNLKLKV